MEQLPLQCGFSWLMRVGPHQQAGDGQRRARTALVPGQESGLVCGARRPPDARTQHSVSSGPQRHRAAIVRDAPVFLTGVAPRYNLVPYQRCAKHASQCGVEVEGGRLPTADWFLNLQLLTSGGLR